MNEWSEFYARECTLLKCVDNINKHTVLFEEILKSKPKRILEVGVGTASMSIFMSHLGLEVTSIDSNEEILNQANIFARKLNEKVCFILCDAFELSKKFKPKEFDIIFSQGFFEHFQDEQIVRLLEEQLKVGKAVIFSVPSKYRFKRDFGDERLLSIHRWKGILKDFDLDYIGYYGNPGIRMAIKKFLKNPFPPYKKFNHILIKIKGKR